MLPESTIVMLMVGSIVGQHGEATGIWWHVAHAWCGPFPDDREGYPGNEALEDSATALDRLV